MLGGRVMSRVDSRWATLEEAVARRASKSAIVSRDDTSSVCIAAIFSRPAALTLSSSLLRRQRRNGVMCNQMDPTGRIGMVDAATRSFTELASGMMKILCQIL